MWMLVLFDLPVVETEERKAATAFRNFLLDHGFFMVQYSIYTKVLSGPDACQKYYNLIEKNLPDQGKIDIITITDKQYANIKSYVGASKTTKKNTSEQLLLF
jgi:CRISPR-associated protein Cas2